MTIYDQARNILSRTTSLARIAGTVHDMLLHDQHDAVSPGVPNGERSASGHGDPTARGVYALAMFAKWERDLHAALRAIDNAMNDAEVTFQRVITESGRHNRGQHIDAEERCPGWNDELRAQLGGCGKILETYRTADGRDQVRSTRLCVGCRKAKERAEREEQAA